MPIIKVELSNTFNEFRTTTNEIIDVVNDFGSGVFSFDAASITTGTLLNARTTGNSANSANTLVLRDSSGDFAARTITANTFSGSIDWANVINKTDNLSTVTGRGANTASAISLTNTTASTSTTTGALIVAGGVGIAGALNATSKSFIIKHPTKDGMLLRYGSLEGPELGVYVRGRNSSNTITLPDYWKDLVDSSTISVQLTPIGKNQKLYLVTFDSNTITVGNDYDEHMDYFYTVYAERKDIDKLVVEYSEE